MSINKFAVSVALAGILGASSALAETSGAFVGVQGAYGSAETNIETGSLVSQVVGTQTSDKSLDFGAFRYGFVAGYKQFFTDSFGLRYYGMLDYGTNIHEEDVAGETISVEFDTLNVNANVDALYNFISGENLDFGVFAGVSLGYANLLPKDAGDDESGVGGFDAGINLGVRVNLSGHHGIELFSRIGVAEQKEEGKIITTKFSQPYQIGLRYAFSF